MYEVYLTPHSIEETLIFLKKFDGLGRVIAGGTDLIVLLKEKKLRVKGLVDVSAIDELRVIKENGEMIVVGATVKHHDLDHSELIRGKATALAEAAHAVGSPQIRRLGTVGGNVVNAQPAADTAVALAALDAMAEVHSSKGIRLVAFNDLYNGIGDSKIHSDEEVLVNFTFKAHGKGEASAFERLSKRKALSLPMVNVAVFLSFQKEIVKTARIVVAPVSIKPLRMFEAEDILIGTSADPETVEKTSDVAAEMAKPRDSLFRGSTEYRKAMVKVLVKQAILKTSNRANGL